MKRLIFSIVFVLLTSSFIEYGNENSKILLLNHEQLHFDISEIHARTLRQELLKIKFSSSAELKEKVKELYDEVFFASVNFQKKYDKETNHSKNSDKQLIWNEIVKDSINRTNDYRTVMIIINK